MSLGLVLSGGGTRGFAHLGAIKALEELGYKPTMISGASAGAIAGAFYCYGYSPDEIFEIIIKTNVFKIVRPALNSRGLLKLDVVEDVLLEYLPENDFESLKIPLFVAATNLVKGHITFFSKGELIKPVIASSCVPLIFTPIAIEEEVYVDGGILNNLPVEPLIGHCDKIIGVHTNPISDNFEPSGWRGLIERTALMSINTNVQSRKHYCDLFIEPTELEKYKVFDLKRAEEVFDIGYTYIKGNEARVHDKMRRLSPPGLTSQKLD